MAHVTAMLAMEKQINLIDTEKEILYDGPNES
jgi:hypothetical protein